MSSLKYAACAVALTVAIPASFSVPARSESGTFGSVAVQPGPVVDDKGRILIPDSSIERPEDRGKSAHTHHLIFVPKGQVGPTISPNNTFQESPASIACVYGLVTTSNECNPSSVTKLSRRGSNIIAIVDAFHNPNAVSDLKQFSSHFGLLQPNVTVVFCNASTCGVSTPPRFNSGWALEIALDVQWAHAIAPKTKIVLIEASSNSLKDLLRAEDKAGQIVKGAGGGEVSNSWGTSEFSGETTLDSHFATTDVVYFASTGDSRGTQWPSVSQFVAAVGGTTINRKSTGGFQSESAWKHTGGGLSSVISRPTYQNGISGQVGNRRGVPDIAADADPASGVPVLCTPCGGWFQVGGTSLASPLVAAITNLAATAASHFAASTKAELTSVYHDLGDATKFNDVKTGVCGADPAVAGWDRCTGVGTPHTPGGLKNDITPAITEAEAQQ